jgi:hypothetical protein
VVVACVCGGCVWVSMRQSEPENADLVDKVICLASVRKKKFTFIISSLKTLQKYVCESRLHYRITI